MKKIIATVLAMVMALALCTTAFAAAWTETLHTKDTDAEYKFYAEVKATCTTKGHGAYYTTLDKDGTTVLYYREAAKTEVETTTVAFKEKTNAVRLFQIDEDELGYVVPVYGHDLSKLSADEAVTCTVDGYKKGTFKCATCNKYFNLIATGAEASADGRDFNNYDPNGLTVGTYNMIDTAAEMDASVNYATHIFYKLTNEFDAMGQQEYKCAVCGEVVAAKAVTQVNGDDATVKTFKTLYGTDKLKFYYGENNDVIKAWVRENGTFNTLKPIVQGNMVYVTVTASSTTPSTNTNKPSPKTFDAGIAMYVGMALTSVAGSAVVIGKKKEF